MAITQVGTVQVGNASNGGNVTLTFDGSPAQDDYVFVVGAIGDTGSGNLTAPTGYTEVATQDTVSEPYSVGVWYKKLGASPDSSVTFNGTGAGTDATAACSVVLRGVDTTTPIDQTTVKTGPSTSSDPDLSAITTVTDNAWVLLGIGSNSADSDVTQPTGYTPDIHELGVDTNRASVTYSAKEVTSAGSEDPGAWTGFASADWTGFTVAVRPAGTLNFPDAPTNLVANAVSISQIDLSWDAVTGAGGYDIERDGSIIVSDHASTSYSDTGLSTGTSYDYRVRART